MKYSEAKQGRVFVIRLEDGDVVHEVIITELVDCSARRVVESATGFALLQP